MALYKVKGSKYQSGGHWVTVKEGRWKGQHVFIKDGQTFDDAIAERAKHSKGLEDRPVADKLAKQKANKSEFYNKLNNEDKKKYDDYIAKGYSKSDIENTLMYKTKEQEMKDAGIKFVQSNKLELSEKQIEEGNRLTNKAENGVRDDIKAFLSGKENYDGSQEQFINDLSDNWGVDKERVTNILHEESSKHPRLFKGDIPEKDNKIIPGTMFHEKPYDEIIDLRQKHDKLLTDYYTGKDNYDHNIENKLVAYQEKIDSMEERQQITRELAREIYGKGISDEVADRYGKNLQQPGEGTVTTDLEDWEFDRDKLEYTNEGLKHRLIELQQGKETADKYVIDAKNKIQAKSAADKIASQGGYRPKEKTSEYYDEREKNALLNKDMTYSYSDKALKNMSNQELNDYINKQTELLNEYSDKYETSKTYDQRTTRNRQDTVWNKGMKTKYEGQLKRANDEKIRREEDVQRNFRVLTPEESKEQDIKLASGQTLNRKEISKQEKEERLIDNMIVGSYGNYVSYRDKNNDLWTAKRDRYNKYVNGEQDKLGGTYAVNDEHALKNMITDEAFDKYEYKGYSDEKNGTSQKRDEFINSEFKRLKSQAFDSTNTRKERVKTNENYAKYYNSEGIRHDIAKEQAKQKEDMLKNGFKQKVDMTGGEYYYEPERIKSMEKAGIRPMANSYTGGGWEGVNSNLRMDTKDQAKAITDAMKKQFPDVKISRKSNDYSGGSSIDFNVMSSGKDLFVTDKDIDKMGYEQLKDVSSGNGFYWWATDNVPGYKENRAGYTIDDVRKYAKYSLSERRKSDIQNVRGSEWYLTDYGKQVMQELNKQANSYTYSDSDGMVDYFDHGTYMHINIGKWNKPYEVSQPKTTTKAMNMSKLVQSYVDRGYSEETARKMAKQAINKRKRK